MATAVAPKRDVETVPETASKTAGPPGVRWLVIESRLLDDEQFLVVFEKKHLKEARKAHPGKVIYFPPEVDELYRHKDAPDYPQFLKSIHLVKKKFGGWIIPSDSPLARRLEATKKPLAQGGHRHGTATRGKQVG